MKVKQKAFICKAVRLLVLHFKSVMGIANILISMLSTLCCCVVSPKGFNAIQIALNVD